MVGPFPGMDPYLEDPAEWPDVHSRLITAISETLAARVAPAYIVRIEQRVYIADAGDSGRQLLIPDVPLVEPLDGLEVRDHFVEILDTRNRAVVATLEVLSPTNKVAGALGRDGYLRKRRAVLTAPAHWIEIDLLRGGERPPEVAGRSDYYALLRRGTGGPYEVWFWDLRDPLPTIAVPLTPPRPDEPLDLGAILDGVYARAFYAVSIDYGRDVPPPPLTPPVAAWAAARVRDWQTARAAAPP